MSTFDVLQANLLSPAVLAFALGVAAKLMKSEIALPKDLYASLSFFLLFAIGIKGGVELTHSTFSEIARPAFVTILLGCFTPISAFLGMRWLGGFSTADSAGVAAHYGSVSAVTFIASQQFCTHLGLSLEGYLPTLLTLMESPGIQVALIIGALGTARATAPVICVTSGGAIMGSPDDQNFERDFFQSDIWKVLHETLTGRSMILLVGGMVLGFTMGSKGYDSIKGFYEGGFKGALVLFLLEMGLVAGARLGDLKKIGPFLLAFGIILPIIHGSLGVLLGHWAGLSLGGCTVLGAMSGSASYIAAPPAVRMTLPDANPAISLTLALAITFPFNLIAGIPLYHQVALFLQQAA